MSRFTRAMPRAIAAGLLCAGLAGGVAQAIEVPASSRLDGRIQYVNYKQGEVFLVRTMPGYATRIVFAPGERILSASSGFTQGWQFNVSGNVLYLKAQTVKGDGESGNVKPEGAEVSGWNTNLAVTTDQRMYDFDLRLLPGSNSKGGPTNFNVAYMVQFRYPEADREKARAAERERQVETRLSAKNAPVNWAYSMQIGKNSAGIAPTLAYDDGRFTYLRFPSNREFPTAFLVADDKSESIVNSHIDPSSPEILVIHRVAKAMVLRLGEQVVGIYNERFDPNGVSPLDGATVPGVKRVLNTGSGK